MDFIGAIIAIIFGGGFFIILLSLLLFYFICITFQFFYYTFIFPKKVKQSLKGQDKIYSALLDIKTAIYESKNEPQETDEIVNIN